VRVREHPSLVTPSRLSRNYALTRAGHGNNETEQGGIMGVRTGLIIGAVAAATAIWAAATSTATWAADEAAFLGTYVQNAPCKGDGKDDAKKLVKIGDKQVDSNFGPCVFSDKQADGKVIKANATCKAKGGSDFEVKLSFTLKDDNTIDFLEEGSQYKSVLYRCPAGK
jgi:hypothetical protein